MTKPSETRGSALKRKHEYLDREFQELQRSRDTLQQLVQALQSRDEQDAFAIFRRIRQHVDAETIMEHIRASDLLLEMQSRPEPGPEDNDESSTPRPPAPTSLPSPDDSQMLLPPPLDRQGIQVLPGQFPAPQDVRVSPWISRLPSSIGDACQASRPPHALAQMMDSRLDAITPSRWTGVPADDDGVLGDLLGRYLIQEYMRNACFQEDQFLDGIMSGSRARSARPCWRMPISGTSIRAVACGPSSTSAAAFGPGQSPGVVRRDLGPGFLHQDGILHEPCAPVHVQSQARDAVPLEPDRLSFFSPGWQ
ncbi:hypothetical protein E4U41_001954 [Claviceps citrina]|nr:hypothetical protein E4U41_001954 [Claviceps citrina]